MAASCHRLSCIRDTRAERDVSCFHDRIRQHGDGGPARAASEDQTLRGDAVSGSGIRGLQREVFRLHAARGLRRAVGQSNFRGKLSRHRGNSVRSHRCDLRGPGERVLRDYAGAGPVARAELACGARPHRLHRAFDRAAIGRSGHLQHRQLHLHRNHLRHGQD